MDQRAHGIIIRTRPLTETSLIVQWLTADLGRISTVAKGARRAKSPFLGKLDLYFEAEFTFQPARKSTLHTLREISVQSTHPHLRTDLAVLEQAARASRRIERATEESTPLPEIYELFHAFIAQLATPPFSESLPLAFEAKLLERLGLTPDPENAPLTPGARAALAQFLALPFGSLRNLKLSHAQVTELSTFLDRALQQATA
jgi:DNA repair protein RecO (recombination protein O)